MQLMKSVLIALTSFAVQVALNQVAQAGVNEKNGNFYISYLDISVEGHDLGRTYNSKSNHKGVFGFGWGCDLETRLQLLPEGAILVRENGSGAEFRYHPMETELRPLGPVIDRLVNLRKAEGHLLTELEEGEFREKLKDSDLRATWCDHYAKSNALTPVLPAVGTSYVAFQCNGRATIHRVKHGFERRHDSGGIDVFGTDGRLRRIVERDGSEFDIEYSAEGHVSRVILSTGRTLDFKTDDGGRILSITVLGTEKKADFKYDTSGNLVFSRDQEANVYVYAYDSHHNMTSIGYDDGSSMKIAYYPGTLFAKSVETRDGQKTAYDYWSDPDDAKNHYSTTIKQYDRAGDLVDDRRAEYWLARDSAGLDWLHRTAVTRNGITTTTVFDDVQRKLPREIRRGERCARFRYDEQGRLAYKWCDGVTKTVEYDISSGKTSKVSTFADGDELESARVWEYAYDARGNLCRARSPDNEELNIAYDEGGRIVSIASSQHTVRYEYNAAGDIVLMDVAGEGKVEIEYDDQGEISDVDAEGVASLIASRQMSILQRYAEAAELSYRLD